MQKNNKQPERIINAKPINNMFDILKHKRQP